MMDSRVLKRTRARARARVRIRVHYKTNAGSRRKI
jgi:hypothetical protein